MLCLLHRIFVEMVKYTISLYFSVWVLQCRTVSMKTIAADDGKNLGRLCMEVAQAHTVNQQEMTAYSEVVGSQTCSVQDLMRHQRLFRSVYINDCTQQGNVSASCQCTPSYQQ